MLVEVKQHTFTWTGELLWEEGPAHNRWAVIRPLDSGTHTRLGSGTREYDEDLIRVPLFMSIYSVTAKQ